MEETWSTLEQATQALANTADRAAKLIRREAERARAEAMRTRGEIEAVKTDVRTVQSEIETVRKTIVSATSDTERVRYGASVAWRCVTAMVVAVVIAVGWTSARLSRSTTEVSNMTARVQDWRTIAEIAKAEAFRLRTEAENARIAQARAEGQLASLHNSAPVRTIGEISAGPTTRPTLMSLLSGLIDKSTEVLRAPPEGGAGPEGIAVTDQN